MRKLAGVGVAGGLLATIGGLLGVDMVTALGSVGLLCVIVMLPWVEP